MRKELKDIEISGVQGGSVVISAPMNMVVFTKLQKIGIIRGNVKDMRDRLLDLYDENMDMEEAAFDQLVFNDFQSKGWI